jgi:hypothetical protein
VIAFAAVSCHTCAAPLVEKFAMFTLTEALLERFLLMIMTVNAPSLVRTAANEERLSGSGATAEMLVSPNVDLLPS